MIRSPPANLAAWRRPRRGGNLVLMPFRARRPCSRPADVADVADVARSRGRTRDKRSRRPDRLSAIRPLTCNYLVAGAVPREIRACEGHMVDTCGTVAPLGLSSGYSGAAWRIHGQGGMRNVRV
jgi:hypothetical protein